MTKQRYTLEEARSILGVSKRKLAKLSGISMSAINAIENDGPYKTNEGVALALVDALGMSVDEIIWPRGLSHLGRPARTGTPLTITKTFTISMSEKITIESDQPICPIHFTVLPVAGVCDRCS